MLHFENDDKLTNYVAKTHHFWPQFSVPWLPLYIKLLCAALMNTEVRDRENAI